VRGPVGAYLVALAPFVAGTVIRAVSPTMAVLLAGPAIAALFERAVHTLLTCALAAVFLIGFVTWERTATARVLPRAPTRSS
jgi:hypothetical protein